MKTNWRMMVLVTLVYIGVDKAGTMAMGEEFGPPPPPPAQQEQARSEATPFYSTLQPYGTWIQVAPFGQVWQPTVLKTNRSWRPYCDGGRWTWQNNAWQWQSEYEWGWAAFHHGRWMLNNKTGWVWVPGRDWSPGWVSWRRTSEQYSWAPMPVEKSLYVNVNGSTGHGAELGFVFSLSDNHYVSAPARDFGVVVQSSPVYEARQTQVVVVREPEPVVVVYRSSMPVCYPQVSHHDSRSRYDHDSKSRYDYSSSHKSYDRPSQVRSEPSRSSAPRTQSAPATPSREVSRPTDRRTSGIQNIMSRGRK